MTGVRFRIEDGASHSVDSSEFSFYQAAYGAMKQAAEEGQWAILEPIMTVSPPKIYKSIYKNRESWNFVW